MSRFRAIVLASVILGGPIIGRAQSDSSVRTIPDEPWELAIGYSAVFGSATNITPSSRRLTGLQTVSASGVGWQATIELSIPIASGQNPRAAFIPLLGVGHWKASARSRAPSVPNPLRLPEDTTFTTFDPMTIAIDVDQWVLLATMLCEITIVEDRQVEVSMVIGPANTLVIANHQREWLELDRSSPGTIGNPQGYPSFDDGRSVLLYDSDAGGIRFAILAGARVALRLGERFRVVNSIQIDYPFLSDYRGLFGGRFPTTDFTTYSYGIHLSYAL